MGYLTTLLYANDPAEGCRVKFMFGPIQCMEVN